MGVGTKSGEHREAHESHDADVSATRLVVRTCESPPGCSHWMLPRACTALCHFAFTDARGGSACLQGRLLWPGVHHAGSTRCRARDALLHRVGVEVSVKRQPARRSLAAGLRTVPDGTVCTPISCGGRLSTVMTRPKAAEGASLGLAISLERTLRVPSHRKQRRVQQRSKR